MTKLKLSLMGAITIAGLATSLVIQHQAQAKLRENDAALRQQDDQLAELTAENQHFSRLIGQAKKAPSNGEMIELNRLHSEAEELRKQVVGFEKKQTEGRRSSEPESNSKQTSRPPEYWDQLHRIAGGKPKDAVILSSVFMQYASDHEGRFPASVDQVEPYFQKNKHPALTGTNEFDIVYHGTRDELKNIPSGAVALIRDRQSWLAPSGKIAKVYGMTGGIGQIVESDDDFQVWEAEHVISPPAADR